MKNCYTTCSRLGCRALVQLQPRGGQSNGINEVRFVLVLCFPPAAFPIDPRGGSDRGVITQRTNGNQTVKQTLPPWPPCVLWFSLQCRRGDNPTNQGQSKLSSRRCRRAHHVGPEHQREPARASEQLQRRRRCPSRQWRHSGRRAARGRGCRLCADRLPL